MMALPNFMSYATCLFMVNMAHLTTSQQSSLPFLRVNGGESVTVPCSCRQYNLVWFYWYKQTMGQTPKLISSFYRHTEKSKFFNEFENDSRFSLDTENQQACLLISDLQISDSATYHCIESDLVGFEFCNSMTVSVQGSGLNIPAVVHQSSSETFQPGGSVSLNCTVHTGTCDGEHSVYWFKDSEQSHPGLIYTHGDRNDQCERKPNTTSTQTCVYNLPMKNLNLSHAGTYYCAVASCGHILFGNRTELAFMDEVKFTDSLVYYLSGALTLTTILVVLLAISVYKMNKRSCQCSAESQRVLASNTPNAQGSQDAENLHYAALRDHKVNRTRRTRDNSPNECVYSSVRQ